MLNIHTVKRMVHSALLVQWFSLHMYSYSCVMKAIQAAIFCAENLLSNCSSPTSNLVTEKGRFYKHLFFIFVFRSSYWSKIKDLFNFFFLKYMNSWYKAIRGLKFCWTLDLSIVTHHVLVRCNSAIYTCMNRLGSAAFVFLFCVI